MSLLLSGTCYSHLLFSSRPDCDGNFSFSALNCCSHIFSLEPVWVFLNFGPHFVCGHFLDCRRTRIPIGIDFTPRYVNYPWTFDGI